MSFRQSTTKAHNLNMPLKMKIFKKNSTELLKWIRNYVPFWNIDNASRSKGIASTKILFIDANKFVVMLYYETLMKAHIENECNWVEFRSSIKMSCSQYCIDERRYNTIWEKKTPIRVSFNYSDDIDTTFEYQILLEYHVRNRLF